MPRIKPSRTALYAALLPAFMLLGSPSLLHAQDPSYQPTPGLKEMMAAYRRFQREGDALDTETRAVLASEGKTLIAFERSFYEGRAPTQIEMKEAERVSDALHEELRLLDEKVRTFNDSDGPAAEGERLNSQRTALLERRDSHNRYLARLNARIEASNRRVAARYAVFSDLVDAAFTGKQPLLAKRDERLRELLQRMDELETLKRRDVAALRSIAKHAPAYNRALEEWASLGEDVRAAAESKAAQAGLSILLFHHAVKLRDQAAMTKQDLEEISRQAFRPTADPATRESYLGMLRELREINSREELIRFLQRSRNYQSIVENIENGKKAELTVAVAKLFVQNPETKFFLADAELLTAIGYAQFSGRIAKEEIDRIDQLAERDLLQLKDLSRILTSHTEELKSLREQERRLRSIR
jgi:hypothetical protein